MRPAKPDQLGHPWPWSFPRYNGQPVKPPAGQRAKRAQKRETINWATEAPPPF